MDAIKKKMQAMKLEKDNAMDRALLCEQQARDANLRAEKAEEEARALQKKIQTIENELDQTQEQLMQVSAKLEEKDKALQNVSVFELSSYCLNFRVTQEYLLAQIKLKVINQKGILMQLIILKDEYFQTDNTF